MNEIKVGYLVSYDYYLIKESLPTVYEHADSITLALDRRHTTWQGSKFEIENTFFDWIKKFDINQKIQIYLDDFYIPELSPMDCETRERNLLAKQMGEGGWHIQVDCDEYFIDFNSLIKELKDIRIQKNQNLCVFAKWITMYKQIHDGFLIVHGDEYFPLATNNPNYDIARRIKGAENLKINSPVLHQSWARSKDEVRQKLNNWGHSNDFNIESYFNLWNAIDRYNYKNIINFHPLTGNAWKSLELIEKTTISDLIQELQESSFIVNTTNKRSVLEKIFHSITPPVLQKFIKKTLAQ